MQKKTVSGMDTDRFASARVLFVEDNRVNQAVGKAMFERIGCRIEIAQNGAEAVEAFAQGQFDLILMDCQMPEMDGYEATKCIRGRENELSLRRTPITALTANAMEGDREKCLAAGMDDYLPKPFRFEQLLATMERWVDDGKSRPTEDGAEIVSDASIFPSDNGLNPGGAVDVTGGQGPLQGCETGG